MSTPENTKRSTWSKLTGMLSSPLGGKAGANVLPIGIDFGVGALRLLQVSAGSPATIVAAAEVETPVELLGDHKKRLEFQFAQLPRLVREGGFRSRRAVCAIPSWRVFCKHLHVNKPEGVPLSTVIDAALPAQLGCDPASIMHRCTEVGTTAGKTEVIVVASPRDLVDRLVRGMATAKLEPVGMHSEFTATLRAFDGVHRRDGDDQRTTLYLDMGMGTTNVLISHGTHLAFARVVEIGGRHLDESLAKQLSCGIEEARAKRLGTGMTAGPMPRAAAAAVAGVQSTADGVAVVIDPGADRRGGAAEMLPGLSPDLMAQPAAAVSPENTSLAEPLEILTDEVGMCLRYHASQHAGRRVDRVIFVGSEAKQRGLCQHIARTLKLPGNMADPLARLARTGTEPATGVDLRQPQPGWAVAMGLCMSPTDL
jgi:type IV pilus assembly protein PilM